MNEVPPSPACQAPALNFIIWYHFEPDVLRVWFLHVQVEVGRLGDSHYLGSELPSLTSCLARVPRLVSGVGVGLPSPGGVSSAGVGLSPLSRMDDLMRSYTSTPDWGCLRLDLSRARVSATSLSHRGCDEVQNHQTSPPAFLPPDGMPPCGSHGNWTPP
jgi:hypothetical protein